MKKTLKVIASAAIAMSAFASVAMADDAATTSTTTSTTTATKTSADFKDLANVDAALKAKIDAMLKAGVFEGTAADSFGINENMTRAQAAKVLDLIYNVKVDASVKTSSFADVKADDIANGWAIPFIEAAKKAGYIDGKSDTSFDPGAKVTLGEFATMLVKGLGVKPDVTGTPWYADAVKQAVAKNLLPAGTDGSKDATRADLVVGAYSGQQAYADANKPAQVSVASVKAIGVKTVQVTLDRDVDTSKATLSLTTAGSVAVATTTKWSDDKKSATLTLTDTVLRAGDYKVTLGGLDASAVKTTTGTFTAQDEVVQKIEFVTASDTIAKASNVVVKLKATNQYGEMASAAAGNYNFYGPTKLTKSIDGYLLATVDTSSPSLTSGVGIVTITIINNDSHVTVTKNFTVGTPPILTKLDLGAAQYTNGKSLTGTGDNAKFALNLYDQYGSMMGFDALNIGGANELKPTVIWNDYLDGVTPVTEDDGNNNPVLKISLSKNVDKSGDYNFTVIDQAASATGKLTIQSAKVATKIQIGAMDDVIAAGDKDAYIPVIAYDASGNQLSVDDLVSDDNYNRITVSASGADNRLQKTGQHKGTIHLPQASIPTTKNGAVSVSVFIATANVSSTDTRTYTVQGARIPDHFKEMTAPGTQITAGGYSKFKYAVIDQYGKQLDTLVQADSQGNANTGSSYTVTVSANVYDNGATTPKTITKGTWTNVVSKNDTFAATGTQFSNSTSAGGVFTSLGNTTFVANDSDPAVGSATVGAAIDSTGLSFTTGSPDLKTLFNNKTYRFESINDAAAPGSKIVLTMRIVKDGTTEISKLTKTVTVAGTNDTLTYTINSVPALWNAKDSGVVVSAVYDQGATLNGDIDGTNSIGKNTQLLANSKFGREVTISGKNAAGETVGVAKRITGISSSDTNVANVYMNGSGKAYVIGNKVGTASIAVSFTAADGTSKTVTAPITVKNDALTVANVTWDDKGYTDKTSFNAFQNLNVTDSYGITYEDSDAKKYNYALGITFAVSNVVGGTASVDQYGNVTTSGVGVSFDLTATSATGKSATASITTNADGFRTSVN